MRERRLLWGAAIFAGWTLVALLFVPQSYLLNQRAPVPPTWTRSILSQLPMYWAWALLTPAVIWFGRRFPLGRRHTWRYVPLYLAGAFACALIHLVIAGGGHMLIGYILSGAYRPFPGLQRLWMSYGATNVFICFGILAASQALTYFQYSQERELRLAQAQLQSLRTQLHPHFLFNTLNAIAELIYRDTGRAERTITQLSDLLRTALSRVNADEVPLQEELDFVRNYLDIQQTLMQERLITLWDIDDEVLDAGVPGMLLQPLVENAIQHGIGPRASGGMVTIQASAQHGRLVLAVQDDGVGVKPDVVSTGIGLANTRARLGHLYGDAWSLELTPRPGGGTVAKVTLPLRRI